MHSAITDINLICLGRGLLINGITVTAAQKGQDTYLQFQWSSVTFLMPILDFTGNDHFGRGKHVVHCLVKIIVDYDETLHPQLVEETLNAYI